MVVLRLRRLALLHLLFVAVFLIAPLLGALLDQISSAKGGVMSAFFGLGVASFFLAPPVVSFLYARKLNAWKAFWLSTVAGIFFSLGGAFLGFCILFVFSRSCSDAAPYPKECTVVGLIAIAIALLPNFIPPLVSYLMLRKKILLALASSGC